MYSTLYRLCSSNSSLKVIPDYNSSLPLGFPDPISISCFSQAFYKLRLLTGGCRKLHNEELHNLYSSPSIIRVIKSRRMRWAGHAARMEERRNAYRILLGKPEGKRPLGRPRRRWVDNIKMDLREVGWDGRDRIDLAQDRDWWRAYVNAVMNLWVP
jgi:hypothetical protein